jgi:hypothetical protein
MRITARHRQLSVTESSVALGPVKACIMTQIQATRPICPLCHQPMRLMLVKEMGGRKLRCIDCGQPDPLKSLDTQGWFKGELGSKRSGLR